MRASQDMEDKLRGQAAKGVIVIRTENNPHLKVSYKGAGTVVSEKWNVKIYTSGSVVCNDMQTLVDLITDSVQEPDRALDVVQIDDSGWGFPLCGVMVGVAYKGKVYTDTVDASFFQTPKYSQKLYMKEYTQKGLGLLKSLKINPKTHRIEICTGYINTGIRDSLREQGYDVRVVEIKGVLQDQLEDLFKAHVLAQTGEDLAYDPKLVKGSMAKPYYRALNWGKKNAPHLLKSGWESMK